ncbi:MAG: hypothetical protein JNN04_12285 [Cyclobacteriaceae bacterium]|nr:hypothetical protein [Cyclobacteriaceae bacterium]
METGLILILMQGSIIIFIGAWIRYYYKYFERKGENLAKREDIAELTAIVQGVEHRYTKDIESLKANLTVLTNRKSSVFEEEKNALVDFFTSINYWTWNTLNIEYHEYFHGNFDELTDRILKFREAYKQTNVSFSKVQLLVRNPDLIQAGHLYITESLKLHSFVDMKISGLKRILLSEKINVDASLRDMNARPRPLLKTDPINKYLFETAIENKKEKIELLKDYNQGFLELQKVVFEKREIFIEKAKRYLNDLEDVR